MLPSIPPLPGAAQVAIVKAKKYAGMGRGLSFWALPAACAGECGSGGEGSGGGALLGSGSSSGEMCDGYW
jgi:hypothetical protein